MYDAAAQPPPMLAPGPAPSDEQPVSLEKHPEPHPLMPGEAPPAWAQPGQEWAQPSPAWQAPPNGWQQPPNGWQQPPPPGWQQGQYVQQPPPGWVGAWHPPVPPTPTDDPSTWPQMGVTPGAGPNVGSWAVAHPDSVPDDQG